MTHTRLAVLTLLVLVASFILSSTSAQAIPAAAPLATDPVPVGQIGGVTTAVALSGNNLFFNVGPRLARVAVSAGAPLTPTLPAAYSGVLPGIPEDMQVANGYVYVALGRAGVVVVDAATLQVVTTEPLTGTGTASATAIALGANSGHLYLAAGLNGIVEYAIDFDHTTLTYLQTKTFTTPVRRVLDVETRVLPVTGDEYLFVAANNFSAVPAQRGGVLQFNISTEPMLADPVTIKEQIDVNALSLTDDYVFAAGEGAFYALDAVNLGTTGSLATLVLPGRAVEVALRPGAQHAYVLDAFGGIDVLNVTTPLSPTKLTVNPFYTNGAVQDLAPAEFGGNPDTYLYLADFYAGLSIASAPQSTPQNLSLDRPSYLTPKPAISSLVGATSSQAFVYSIPSTLWTVDTADLSALTIQGAGIVPSTTINAIVPYSTSLLVADQFGLTRYQINPGGEPSTPEVLTFPGSGSANDIAVTWPYAIIADGSEGLVVVDLADTLVLTGSVPAPLFNSDFRSVDVQGNYAYVGDYNGTLENVGRLRIYDLTNPTAPVATGSVSQTGILDVKVSGNFAFMAVGPDGVRVADVSNPAAPVIISTDDYTGTLSAQSLTIYQNYLFVAQGDDGVQMLAFNPTTGQLRLVTTIPTSGAAQQLAWTPGRLYIADDYAGLVVAEVGNDLAITKTAPTLGYLGQPFTYTLAVGNVGVVTATNLVVTDVLPANLALLSASGCANAAGVVTCTLPSLAIGSNATFNVVVQPSATEEYSNTVHLLSDQLDVDVNNNTSTAYTTILPAADLALSKSASSAAVYIGDQITYTLVVSNAGPSTATGLVLTDTLPAGVTLVQANLGCSGTTTIVCNVGNLNVGVTQTVSIVVAVTANAAPTVTNTATVTANEKDFTPATATAVVTVKPVADLSITKSTSTLTGTAGLPLTYSLIVHNFGPSTATGVVVTDTLPATANLVSTSGGACSGTSVIVCNVGSLLANGESTVMITVLPTASGVISNSAQVGSNVYDPNLANNIAAPVVTSVKARIFMPIIRR